MASRSSVSAVAVLIGICVSAGVARAGGGQILLDFDPGTGNFAQGRIQAKMYVDLPRTQKQLEAMKRQLEAASAQICDYTDGLFRIDSVKLVNHPAERKNADFWWFDRDDRAVAGAGTFGLPGAHFNIYRLERGDVIAHEMGHLVFGLGDQYQDSRAKDGPRWRGGVISGVGVLKETSTMLDFFRPIADPHYMFKDLVIPNAAPPLRAGSLLPLYNAGISGDPWYLVNNSIMQQSSRASCGAGLFGGSSAQQLNPALWVDTSCLSAEDTNGDAISDDCGPHCVGGTNDKKPCLTNAECGAGSCGGGAARFACTTPPSRFGDSCGRVAGAPDNAACDSFPGAGDGSCAIRGLPFCVLDVVNTSSELTTVDNYDLDRFNMFAGTPIAPSAPGTTHIQDAEHLVLQGMVFPTSKSTPELFTNFHANPCAQRTHDFTFSPAGVCTKACDPATNEGDVSTEFGATYSGLGDGHACPFSDLTSSPNNPMCTLADNPLCPTGASPNVAFSDQCVLGNSAACLAMFGTSATVPAGAPFCGDGVVNTDPSPLGPNRALWRRIEQCDNGSAATGMVAVNAPLINPLSGQPLRCDQLGDFMGPDRAPSPPLSGGLVHCQANCFLDLSRCSRPLLEPSFDPGPDSILSLVEARKQSTLTLFAEAYDSKGKIKSNKAKPELLPADGEKLNLRDMGPSNHGVFAFLRRMLRFRVSGPGGTAWPLPSAFANHVYHEVWQLTFALDEGEFQGDSFGGRMHEVRRFELEFEVNYGAGSSRLLSINGRPCDGAGTHCVGANENEWPQIFLGFPVGVVAPLDPYVGTGPCYFGTECSQPQTQTGPFQREVCDWNNTCTTEPAPAVLNLRLDLRSLLVRLARNEADEVMVGQMRGGFETASGPVSMYARHGLQTVMGLNVEVPQYGESRYLHPQWPDVCKTKPADPCCYSCSSPPASIPAACKNALGRDACQEFDRQARFNDIFTFNTASGRHDTSKGTLDYMEGQFFGATGRMGLPDVARPTTIAQEQALETQLLNDLTANPNAHMPSEWKLLADVMQQRWGITIPANKIPATGQATNPSSPVVCAPPTVDLLPGGAVDVNQDLQVVFVLDRSGSMSAEDANANEETRSRLDYVKIAAHNFLDDMLAKTLRDGGALGPKVGLVWYNDLPEARSPQLTTTACTSDAMCPASQSCVARGGSQKACTANANCASGEACINQACSIAAQSVCAEPLRFLSNTTTSQALDIANFKSQMVASHQGIAETPQAAGSTGTGAALSVATHLFNPGRTVAGVVQPPTKIILLLSDGLYNRPAGGVCLGKQFCTTVVGSDCMVGTCGSGHNQPCGVDQVDPNTHKPFGALPGCWPGSFADKRFNDALNFAQTQGIQVFSIPLGNESDKTGAQVLAGKTQGELFEATRNFGEDTVPVFMQARAATQGEQLTRTHHAPPYVELIDTIEFGFEPALVWNVKVETGSRSLEVRVSDFDALQDPFDTNGLALLSPSGDSYSISAGAPGVEVSDLSAIIRINTPVAGTWKLYDSFPRIGGTPTAPEYYTRFYVAAHVDNPGANCFVSTSTTTTGGTAQVLVFAEASYERPIVEGVTYTGTLLRPDQTMILLNFERDPSKGTYVAKVAASDLAGRGNYVANVRCDVGADSKTAEGEQFPGSPDRNIAPVVSPAFTREAASTFFLNVSQAAPVPGLAGNNQNPAVLNALAARDCPPALLAAGRCFIPVSLAPVVPFLNDADGDGIPNSAEPPATVDSDGDGAPDVFDSDANGNEAPDGNDPCLNDSQPPVVTVASATINQCAPVAVPQTLTATATDNCSIANEITFTAQVTTVNGKTVSIPVTTTGNTANVLLPPGTATVRWTAADKVNNTSAPTSQTVTVNVQDTSAACCQSGMTVVQGTSLPDFISRPLSARYCIFGQGGIDTILTGPMPDYLSGGTSGDLLTGSASGDIITGGAGDDWLKALTGPATIYGGDGNDVIEAQKGGVIVAGAGNDSIDTDFVAHTIYPGPGRDTVHGGIGDDTIVIRNVCEVQALEILNAGFGNDTLVTPVPVTELLSRGVVLVGFENIVIDTSQQHLSECF